VEILRTHIYIVDDDESFGRSLKRVLNARGLAAEYFLSARSFLNSFVRGSEESVAVIDINMPECNGFSLLDKMHDSGCSIPAIIITGQFQANSEKMALQHGAIGYLEKPFEIDSLLNLICNMTKGGKYEN
jgi:FixJ family two-component response regulator